ncbi:ribonuclease P [Candidatus Woesearchaeota archaeon]|nr:ribonuclease P [Candidatus Woesearchaeota archaeon]
MKLPPSLKQKKRYIVFEIIAKDKFTPLEINQAINEALHDFLGQLGLAKSSPHLLKEKIIHHKFILKINHNWVDQAKTAVILIKKIKNTPIIIKSITTSGTLKKASIYL